MRCYSVVPRVPSAARDIKNKVLFMKHALEEKGYNLLKRVVVEELNNRKIEWAKQCVKYLDVLGISVDDVVEAKKSQVKSWVEKWDSEEWTKGLEVKRTMALYREMKMEIREEQWMKNGNEYSIMMRARGDALSLGWRRVSEGGNQRCLLCDAEEETLNHFLLECHQLQNTRNKYMELQLPRNNEEESKKLMKRILLFLEDDAHGKKYYIEMIARMWRRRDGILKEIADRRS